MTYLLIVWRNLWQKPLHSLLSIAVIASSIAMTIVVMLLSSSIQQGLIKAAEPFDLIVGAKGSPNQLVLNTVFLQDVPIGNIDYDLVEALEKNPLVQSAIPIGFGDNYRGFRLISTEERIFEHVIKNGEPPWLQLAQGRKFTGAFEAVLGAKTAEATGLKLGDQFTSSHGVIAGAGEEEHAEKFTVVGILKDLNGPYDSGILVTLESIWHMHEHGHAHAEVAGHDEHENEKSTTVILVKPKGYAEAMRLYQQFQKNQEAQLIFPAQVVVQLFAILGEGQKILQMIGNAVLTMAMLVSAFSVYWSAISRTRERAILRAIGAGDRDILAIVFGEGAFLVLSGTIAGVLFGHGIFSLIANILQKKTAIAIVGTFSMVEMNMIIAVVLVGMIMSIVPAVHTAKKDIADDL
jgi:putative ABC transport system permease protein